MLQKNNKRKRDVYRISHFFKKKHLVLADLQWFSYSPDHVHVTQRMNLTIFGDPPALTYHFNETKN